MPSRGGPAVPSPSWAVVLRGALVHVAAWVFGYWAIVWLFAHSPSRDVYGVISGWWLAAYAGAWFIVRWKSALLGAACYFVFCIAVSLISGGGYPGVVKPFTPGLDLVFLAIRALLFASPVVLNEIGFWIRSKRDA